MPTVWRVVTARLAEDAFSGEGARRYGGRWNPKGLAIVYTAGSQSLAMLEMLVQDAPLRARYMMIPVVIPNELAIERVVPDHLPANWREANAVEHLRRIGFDWVSRLSSCAMAVPSAVVPAETNYLINPMHPEFAKITIGLNILISIGSRSGTCPGRTKWPGPSKGLIAAHATKR